MTSEPVTIRAIYRYPVKGLSPQPLERTRLSIGQTIPADRLYAIENGPCGFDPAAPAYFPKQRFLMLMRNERLASLRTDYDDPSHTTGYSCGRPRGGAWRPAHTPRSRSDRDILCRILCRTSCAGRHKVLYGAGHSFSDVARKVVSIINLASVAAIENAVGAPVNPLRFRGNLYVAGWPAWHEFDLIDRTIVIDNKARLQDRQTHRALCSDRC